LNVKILDGANHNTVAAAGDSMILLDSNGNNIYGDNAAALDTIVEAVPALDNTLCVNAETYAGSLVFVSFASLTDKFTFTGDSQIAHTAAANVIALAACKGETEGEILISSLQGGLCNIDYELDTGYCTTDAFDSQVMTYGAVGGNKMLIEGASVFGDAGDMFQVYLYSDTPGVYFQANPAGIFGYTPAQDPCTIALGGGAALAPAWTSVNEGGTLNPGYAAGGACAIASANRIRELRSATFTGIHTIDTLEVDIPNMVFDTSIVGAGTEVDIRVAMRKYPCGEIFSGTRTIGTFVTTCTVAGGTTTLMFPFMPPLDGSIAGWWGGFLIVNWGTTAGTATLTFTEADGDSATLTSGTIAANGGMYNPGSGADILSAATPAAGNTGTFGDSNVSVRAMCAFPMGGGFAFTGNGDEGTGYTAYTNAGWQ
jgi:hypothetical protein